MTGDDRSMDGIQPSRGPRAPRRHRPPARRARAPRRSRPPRITSGRSAGGSGWSWPWRSRWRPPAPCTSSGCRRSTSVTAAIEIKPPKVDPAIAELVSHGDVGRGDADRREIHPRHPGHAQRARALAQEVVRDPGARPARLGPGRRPGGRADRPRSRPARSPSRTSTTSPSKAATPTGSPGPSTSCSTSSGSRPTPRAATPATRPIVDASRTMEQYIARAEGPRGRPRRPHPRAPDPAPGGRSLKEAEYETLRPRLSTSSSRPATSGPT